MITPRILLLVAIASVLLNLFSISSAQAADPGATGLEAAGLEAAVAVEDITAPVGFRLSGYYSERGSTGTHDPLYAKAIVLRQGDVSAALVFCDLIGISSTVTTPAREQASAKTGIPKSNILIAATHSHTGPLYFGTLRDFYHEQAIKREGKDPCETVDYPAELTAKLVSAIEHAYGKLRPLALQVATPTQEGLSFNRRFFMKSGGPVRFNPGKLNPDIDRPAGPIDPEVGFLLARDPADQTPLFSLTMFALHLDTTTGTEYSADYPSHLEETLRKSLGENLVSVFGNGTCGDINHIDVTNDRPQGGVQEAQRIGTTLGETVVKSLETLRPVDNPSLGVRAATLDVPLRTFTPEELAKAQAIIAKGDDSTIPFMDKVIAHRTQQLADEKSATIPLDVQVFRINKDVAIVGLPGEVFVDLGLAIKNASPFKDTFVVELANQCPDYVPTKKAMVEGSYETENCLVQPGGGEMLVDTAVRLLNELAKN